LTLNAENFSRTLLHQVQQETFDFNSPKAPEKTKNLPENPKNQQKCGRNPNLHAIAQQKKECQIEKT
jgi:hypothetical protein